MMILVTGGASSGKSAFAEDLTLRLPGPRYYFAAMKPFGEEAARRIARHRDLRAGKGLVTVECFDGVKQALESMQPVTSADARGTVLLECLGNVVANELFGDDGSMADSAEALKAVLEGVSALEGAFDNLVVVGNEVGADGMRYEGGTDAYVEVLGAAACALAQRCDAVVECVYGQPTYVKGNPLP